MPALGRPAAFRLPEVLDPARREAAADVLACYYGLGAHGAHASFTGARFDAWDSTGTRALDVNRFTADDVVAVSFLSVFVPPRAAAILIEDPDREFTRLLEAVPDRDLVEERAPWPADWPGWALHRALLDLDGVGATTASKLLARKRPRLRPIYDSVVAKVTGTEQLWDGLRRTLLAEDWLHPHLVKLGEASGIPSAVPPLRVFDVLAWMEGTEQVPCPALGVRPR
jgi:hypothetical protein